MNLCIKTIILNIIKSMKRSNVIKDGEWFLL